jgi:hypothetical protein
MSFEMGVEFLLVDLERVDSLPVSHFRPPSDIVGRQGYSLALKEALPLEEIILGLP